MWREQHCLLCGLVFLFFPLIQFSLSGTGLMLRQYFSFRKSRWQRLVIHFVFRFFSNQIICFIKLSQKQMLLHSREALFRSLLVRLSFSRFILQVFSHCIHTNIDCWDFASKYYLFTISRLFAWVLMIKMFLARKCGPPFVNSGLHLSGHYKEAKLIYTKYLRETSV